MLSRGSRAAVAPRLSRPSAGTRACSHAPRVTRLALYRVLQLIVVVALLSACESSTAERTSSPRLVVVDSVTLAESDSSFVAQPSDLVVTPAGGFVVSDAFLRTLLTFGPDGRFQSTIGRRGDGPGEFQYPLWLALSGDSVIYASNYAQVQAYDLRTGAFVGQNRFELPPRMMQVVGSDLFVGHVDSVHQGSIAVLDIESGATRTTGPFPTMLNHPMARAMFAGVALAVRGDSIASAYTVSDKVFISRRNGTVLDSIGVPVARRHGAKAEAIAKYLSSQSREDGEEAVKASVPMDLQWLTSGQLALVTMDWVAVNGRITGTYYLSVLDPSSRRGCVDARIPGPPDPAPTLGFSGDTLVVLSQNVVGEKARVTIHKYRIDTSSCEWVAA